MNLIRSKTVDATDIVRNWNGTAFQRIFKSDNIRKDKMKLIVVSGSRSGVGKTYVAQQLLRSLTNWSALKVTVVRKYRCPHQNNCHICADFKTDYDIITDEKIINQKYTDTARLRQAGAEKVVWLKTTLRSLRRGFKKALSYLEGSKGIVIEGTSVLKYINPDLAIFLNDNTQNLRRTAKEAQRKSDIVINISR